MKVLALLPLLAFAACASQPLTPLPPRPSAEELARLNTPRPGAAAAVHVNTGLRSEPEPHANVYPPVDPAVDARIQAQAAAARAAQAAHERALAGCKLQGGMAGSGFHGFGWNGFFGSMIAEARVRNACEAFVREHGA